MVKKLGISQTCPGTYRGGLSRAMKSLPHATPSSSKFHFLDTWPGCGWLCICRRGSVGLCHKRQRPARSLSVCSYVFSSLQHVPTPMTYVLGTYTVERERERGERRWTHGMSWSLNRPVLLCVGGCEAPMCQKVPATIHGAFSAVYFGLDLESVGP